MNLPVIALAVKELATDLRTVYILDETDDIDSDWDKSLENEDNLFIDVDSEK